MVALAKNKEELYLLVDKLPEADTKSAYDYLLFLINRPRRTWEDIVKHAPDEEPLDEEELRQLNSPDEYISFEEAIDKYGI